MAESSGPNRFPPIQPSNPKRTSRIRWRSSTPAGWTAKRVYALFWDGVDMQLYGLDLEAQAALATHIWGPFKSQHGPGTSPMVYQKKVYVANDQDGEADVLAVRRPDGQGCRGGPNARAISPAHSVPFLSRSPPGKPVELILGSTAGLTSYDPDTGRENWNWTTWPWAKMPLRTVASPIAMNGMIIANSGDGSGERNTVAIRPQGRGTLTKEGSLWSKTKTFPYVPNLLAAGRNISISSTTPASQAVHRPARVRSSGANGSGGNFSASPIMIDGKIYAASEEGTVFVFQAAPKYQLLAKNVLDEGIIATPAVASRRMFIRGKNSLYCIGDVSTSSR